MLKEEEKLNPSPRHDAPLPFPPKADPSFGGRKGEFQNFSAWRLVGELGYTIAIPIVVLALAGRSADKMLGTSPWLLLAGILVSIIISSYSVYIKVSKIIR